jgi:3-oxoacyl-[acyl-carrier-protein] synthase III
VTPGVRIGIIGRGFSLGEVIRGNDDPVFRDLIAHPPPNSDLFEGLTYRRVLGSDQTVVSISVAAAQAALTSAGITAQDVDMVLGSVSVGDYYAPSALAAVHAQLNLPDRCRVMGLSTEYTGFLDGLKLSHDLVQNGSMRRALIVAAVDWTSHMDYREAVCVAASDAAGAAVVGPTEEASCFALIDWDNETNSQLYGALRMASRPVGSRSPAYRTPEDLYTKPFMHLDAARGGPAVRTFGISVPPMVVNRLLAKHGLRGQDVTLVAHQVSGLIFNEWNNRIRPAASVSTLSECADMVSASVPVNLAMCYDEIKTEYLVLLGIGMEMHATALLYSRRQGASLTHPAIAHAGSGGPFSNHTDEPDNR